MSSKAEPTWSETKRWAESYVKDKAGDPRIQGMVADLLRQAKLEEGSR